MYFLHKYSTITFYNVFLLPRHKNTNFYKRVPIQIHEKRDPPPHSPQPLAWSKPGGSRVNPRITCASPGTGSSLIPGFSCPEHSRFVSVWRALVQLEPPPVSHIPWSRRCPWKWVWPKTLPVPPAQAAPKTKVKVMLSFQHRNTGRTSAPPHMVISVFSCRLLRSNSRLPWSPQTVLNPPGAAQVGTV